MRGDDPLMFVIVPGSDEYTVPVLVLSKGRMMSISEKEKHN